MRSGTRAIPEERYHSSKPGENRRPRGSLAHWLIGYAVLFLGSVAWCVAHFGFNTTLWGVGLTLLSCTLEGLLLWWQDERQWQKAEVKEDEVETDNFPALSEVQHESPAVVL